MIVVRVQVAVTEAHVGGVVELVNFERAPCDEDVFCNDIRQLPGHEPAIGAGKPSGK